MGCGMQVGKDGAGTSNNYQKEVGVTKSLRLNKEDDIL